MDGSSLAARSKAVVARLGCTPAELAALGVLVTASLALLGVLWLRTPGGDSLPPDPADTADAAADEEFALAAEDVVVHVAGAVREPGVYEVAGGTRVGEAIEAAGGPTRGAVLEQLNLAREVTDGEHVTVPDRAAVDAAAENGSARPDGRVDLNRATAAELEQLPGIGPVTAGRIIDHREAHGPFAQPEDLEHVPGIGERTMETLAELVGT